MSTAFADPVATSQMATETALSRLAPEANGIVIDRFRRQMTVFFVDGTERIVEDHETNETPLLPGFPLLLGRLLQIANRWLAKT